MPASYIQRILKSKVYDVAQESPLEHAAILSSRVDNQVYLKREDLQSVFSFKLRGAYNKIAQLAPDVRAHGVIAASAGNHAQGVALAANRLEIPAVIVMPTTTPPIKVDAVRRLGAEVILHGISFDAAQEYARELCEARALTFVHPFDDVDVIAGQGTIAMEIFRQHTGPIHAIFVGIGGGGLIAGIAAYVKTLWPEVRVIGVEPEEAASMHGALAAGERIVLEEVGLFADGVAVKQVGEEPFRIAQICVDEVILVTTDELCAGIKDIYDDTRSIAEPSGALSVAGMKRYVAREQISGQTLIAIDGGANLNFDRLRHIAERAEIGEAREALLAVTIPEQPGSFRQFCECIGERSVTEFNYRFSDAQRAHVFVGVELRNGADDKREVVTALSDNGYDVVDMTDNEMAKLHVRYMVGGRANDVGNELLYRFEFPERPGALLRFLNRMGRQWSITLFHYRNHGSAYGRVLVGMQVPSQEMHAFDEFLAEVGYRYLDESQNPAYNMFLS
ncbi:MAG: threonine dehydratase [Gammaproteobacteria bacterium]|jgi:threonine dehydratase